MTVLQALNRYYDRMAARGEADPQGWSREKISFAIVLSPEGEPIDKTDPREQQGKKLLPRLMVVPQAVIRKSNILPNLLWDKTAYSLGRTAGEGRRTAEEHAAFRAAHAELLAGQDDPGLVALRLFLETWQPERFDAPPFAPEMVDANIVFRLDGDRGYIHERDAARRLIEARGAGDAEESVYCLVSGVGASPERLHPVVKGVEGGQTSGAALVSFNLDAFTSYGKSQGDNAPTSKAAAFRYGAALNRMLDRGSPNRLPRPVGDATLVFWADASSVAEPEREAAAAAAEEWFGALANPPAAGGDEDAKLDADKGQTLKVGDALRSLAEGRPVLDLDPRLKPGTRFHVLGLSPNAARLSVRYWLDDEFEVLARRLAEHYADLWIEPPPWKTPPSINYLLVQTTALQRDFKNIPPLLAGEVTRAVLSGASYPRTLLSAAIIRLRAGDNPGSGWHAAVIKACLNRSEKEKLPVALDPNRKDTPYQLGRLFCVLESAQFAALGKVNATIGDRYYASASATPARVFGPLLRGLKNHISDARKRGKGGWVEPKVAEIVAMLPPELPRTLKLEEQGRFAIGYYHERATRPSKTEERRDDEQANESEAR